MCGDIGALSQEEGEPTMTSASPPSTSSRPRGISGARLRARPAPVWPGQGPGWQGLWELHRLDQGLQLGGQVTAPLRKWGLLPAPSSETHGPTVTEEAWAPQPRHPLSSSPPAQEMPRAMTSVTAQATTVAALVLGGPGERANTALGGRDPRTSRSGDTQLLRPRNRSRKPRPSRKQEAVRARWLSSRKPRGQGERPRARHGEPRADLAPGQV